MVEIRYRRPPDRLQIFKQYLIHESGDAVVTLARAMTFPRPMCIEGDVVLEDGSDVVWFTFPGTWHDIGRFHRADGTFTGIYANVLTPPVMNGLEWDTTDLFLDVWVGPDGGVLLLDEEEFEEAVGREWLDPDTTRSARREAQRILEEAARGAWPPPVVAEWTRERCLEVLG
jgi:predicted RNA-binding protein associated with RNAse of E/G family